MFRTLELKESPLMRKNSDGSSYRLSNSETKDIINAIFNFDYEHKILQNELSHMFPMSAAYFAFNISITGIFYIITAIIIYIIL